MPETADNLRKAAILIAGLDQDTADVLLQQMPSRRARQVRQAVVELGPIDRREQDRVIAEFLNQGVSSRSQETESNTTQTRYTDTVEVTVDETAADTGSAAEKRGQNPSLLEKGLLEKESDPFFQPATEFECVRDGPIEPLLHLLEHEQPQTIAAVVSQLAPARASQVIARLPRPLQTEVVRRLVNLDTTDVQVLRDVERELKALMTAGSGTTKQRSFGVTAVKAILAATAAGQQREILEDLAQRDLDMAVQLGHTPPAGNGNPCSQQRHAAYGDPFDCEGLVALDDATLRQAVGRLGPRVVSVALVGALPATVNAVLRRLPARWQSQIRSHLAQLRPVRLDDVDQAQRELARAVAECTAKVDLDRTTDFRDS